MPPIVPIEPIYISNFSIGLWSNRSPFSLPGNNPSALLDGLNCEVTPQHTVKRRAGFSSLLTTALAVSETAQRFFSFRQLDSTLQLVVDATITLKAIAVPLLLFSRLAIGKVEHAADRSKGEWRASRGRRIESGDGIRGDIDGP